MKVCIITNLYPPFTVGGAGMVAYDTAKKLKENGYDVMVITALPKKPAKNTDHQTKDLEDGILVYRYWVPNICSYSELQNKRFIFRLVWHIIDSFNVQSAKIIMRILGNEKPDIIHTHNMMGVGLSIVPKISKMGFFHMHTLHDVQLVEPSGVLSYKHTHDNFFQKIYQQFTKNRFKGTNLVVSPSTFLAEFYKKRGFFRQSKWYIVNEHTTQNRLIARMSGRKVDAKFLFVGSLTRHKGIVMLLNAWRHMPTGVKAELHFVGDGPLRYLVERAAHQDRRIVIHGHKNSQQVSSLYKQSDVLIFTSDCLENRPNVIVEALQHQLIVIASNTGGVSELVIDGKNGLLFEPNSEVSLTQRMKQVLFQDGQIPLKNANVHIDPYMHAEIEAYAFAKKAKN